MPDTLRIWGFRNCIKLFPSSRNSSLSSCINEHNKAGHHAWHTVGQLQFNAHFHRPDIPAFWTIWLEYSTHSLSLPLPQNWADGFLVSVQVTGRSQEGGRYRKGASDFLTVMNLLLTLRPNPSHSPVLLNFHPYHLRVRAAPSRASVPQI